MPALLLLLEELVLLPLEAEDAEHPMGVASTAEDVDILTVVLVSVRIGGMANELVGLNVGGSAIRVGLVMVGGGSCGGDSCGGGVGGTIFVDINALFVAEGMIS